MKKLLAALLVITMLLSLGVSAAASGEAASRETGQAAYGLADTENIELDLAAALADGVYSWTAFDEDDDGTVDFYALVNVAYEANITSPQYQYMNIYVPAGYLAVDAAGNVLGVDDAAEVNGFTAADAPIVFNNECSGWNSSTPKTPGGWSKLSPYTGEGIVFVSCGARSRNDNNGAEGDAFESFGKAPTPVADLKAGIIFLKANDAVLPGDANRIFTEGTSGGGQMSSVLGATGNMEEYYPYLYAGGALGVTYDEATGTYASEYDDSVFGCCALCPIADIENADMAYAWMHLADGVTSYADNSTPGSSGMVYEFNAFQLQLQQDLGLQFCAYINSLGLTDAEGAPLTFDANPDGSLDPRQGSYYDAVLANMAKALDKYMASLDAAEAADYEELLFASVDEADPWLVKNDDGSYAILDLDAFMLAPVFPATDRETGEVTAIQCLSEKRNKNIPGFDTFFATGEGNAFGRADQSAVHFSASVASLLEENYDAYSVLPGFADEDVDAYIAQALRGEDAAYIADQLYLMNATRILLDDAAGIQDTTPAKYWRTRNGTADEHTSFSIAFDICLAAAMNGLDTDYSLVWAMTHGSKEGTSTGTIQEWVVDVCRAETPAPKASLDFQALLDDGTYKVEKAAQPYLTTDCYEIAGVRYCENILSEEFQYMNIWIPAAYVNEDGSFNTEAEINGYTVDTAPIIFRNNCSGWFSSSPENDDENSIGLNDYMENGYIYVACGARSRNANNGGPEGEHLSVGKAPAPIVDLKAGIRYLRLNDAAIPGDTDRIISIGGSGAGEMSTLVGATGNMPDYYPYLYAIGAAGIAYDAASDAYVSTIGDDVFGCMAYYPITDIDNADIAYAWMRVNSGETGVHTNDPFPTDADFTPFQLALQEDEAAAFVDYINTLGLRDAEGNPLTLTGLRSGSYYDAVLNNMTAALNAYLAELDEAAAAEYAGLLMATNTPAETWLVKNADDSYAVVDLDGFIHNFGNYGRVEELGTVFGRNKNVPGFDTLALDAENNAFGYDDQIAVHYSRTVARVLLDNYEKYFGLMTDEERTQADLWIEQALTGSEADFLVDQTYLMDAMEILQKAAAGEQETTIAPHWRIRSGTADQHTSFTIGFNTALAVLENGIDCDYSLVWAMIHGNEIEGTSTGAFIDWAADILAE